MENDMSNTPIRPNFRWSELACRCGCDKMLCDPKALDMLQEARDYYHLPIILTSAYRCFDHDSSVRKEREQERTGEHYEGFSFDIAAPTSRQRLQIIRACLDAGFHRIGINFDEGYLHVGCSPTQDVDVLFRS